MRYAQCLDQNGILCKPLSHSGIQATAHDSAKQRGFSPSEGPRVCHLFLLGHVLYAKRMVPTSCKCLHAFWLTYPVTRVVQGADACERDQEDTGVSERMGSGQVGNIKQHEVGICSIARLIQGFNKLH